MGGAACLANLARDDAPRSLMGGPRPSGSCGGAPLPAGVPPPPEQTGVHAGEGEVAFSDFMAAFRSEMREARDQGQRMQKFVPSTKVQDAKRLAMEQRANDAFGVGTDVIDASFGPQENMQLPEEFNEWPDEFLLLGVAEQDAEVGLSPESDTSTTSDTASTEGDTDETDLEEDDLWPVEMLVG